jgi:hypothetical protein
VIGFVVAVRGAAFVLVLTVLSSSAHAQRTCIQDYVSASNRQSLGISPLDVENLITQVAGGIGLNLQAIRIVPCDGVSKAESIYYDPKDPQQGEYILYNPTWIREVIGNDRDEAIVIFGHELGHLLDRDWTTNAKLTRLEKETRADHFAGCAAGALGVKWDKVRDILSRIRGDVDGYYPSREHSLEAARDGLDKCLRNTPTRPSVLIDYKGPPFWTAPENIASDYPSGRWVDWGNGVRKFVYDTEFEGHQTTITFWLPAGAIEFNLVAFETFSAFGDFNTSVPPNNTYYPPPSMKFGSREEVNTLCGSVFDSLLGSLKEKVGPVLDKPNVKRADNSQPAGCQVSNNCVQKAEELSMEVKFQENRNVTLIKTSSYIINDIHPQIYGTVYRTVSESGNCQVQVMVNEPSSLKP